MNDKQLTVLKWWYGGRDYQTGAMLLSKYSKNRKLSATLLKPGKENFGGKQKLAYELTKAVRLNWKQMPELSVVETEIQKESSGKTEQKTVHQKETDSSENSLPDDFEPEYPTLIRRIKYEYSKLYNKRSMSHRKMGDVNTANSKENNSIRASFLKRIKSISQKLDFYHSFISKFEINKTVPEEDTVFPPTDDPEELPDDIKELVRMQKNIRWTIIRNKNTLLYQQRTKAEKENPMPAGPLRDKIRSKIEAAEKTLELVNEKISHVKPTNKTN